ncbi:MAG: BCCT family transporter [Halorhodospira halophila]|uniref:BCCT family transporter n=1 Tax=Halorhodospira TaxID=85108 RepID=UPI0019144291|nr:MULTISPECIES: BCCT family transporter [Halorhodospira]MBK5936970.1 choline transporter [Halorhodospira halophila]MBK5944168.1 choline transporter [Halorhodospira halophila]MCC3749797.1 BCCT family transporter [Halorhodospira halophila]MCG5527713.1 BCCT family transporter [Halorhodospira halophila]MCG5532709.1 BCCT family transporter [Halorhodospira sp. 9621]
MFNVATRGFFKGMSPRVTAVSTFLVAAFALAGAVWPKQLETVVTGWREALTPFLQWYYVLVVAAFLLLVIWLGTGRFKNVRLGQDHEVPEFRTFSWLTMLFAAGMGVGLIFWAVAEPISHFDRNPFTVSDDPSEAADTALRLAYFHWGLNGWAVFSLVALILAYFSFRRGLPLTMRSAFYPLIGKHIHGPWGDAIDVLAVFATVFGIATTLGLGIQQLNTGIGELTGITAGTTGQIAIAVTVMGVATVSVLYGVQSGVRMISEANFWMSAAVLLFFLLWGPTQYLLALIVQSTGDYLQNLFTLSFHTHANAEGNWQAEWTLFYWGWWLAWAPFVGIFIARISRGRKLREFVMGVLLVPTGITIVWIGLFGGNAIHLELFGPGGVTEATREEVSTAVFRTIELMDVGLWGAAASVLVTVLIGTYLITSANAGILVTQTLLSNGSTEISRLHTVIWGTVITLVTIVLLTAGGLTTLQGAVIAAAVPFSFIILGMVVGLLKALEEERFAPRPGERSEPPMEPWAQVESDWHTSDTSTGTATDRVEG